MVSPLPASTSPHPALTQQGFFRLSVDDYHEMGERGILTPADRVELLDGYLVVKPMQCSPHASTVDRVDEDFKRWVPAAWRVRIQLPITLADSEPEPDGAVVRGDRRTFDHRHPGPADTGIIIEVAESTLRLDREVKGPMYARAGILCYWIINLVDRHIEVYSDPEAFKVPASYATQAVYKSGDAVPIILDGVTVGTIAVDDLLP